MRKSCPGVSGRSTEKQRIRPRETKPELMIEEIVTTSILPPETTQATFLLRVLSFFRAANGKTPAVSAINLCFSININKASIISSSLTSIIPST